MNWDTHLAGTFEQAERQHPDLIERYSALLVETDDAAERVAIMRRGLRETICARYPFTEPRKLVARDDPQGALAL